MKTFVWIGVIVVFIMAIQMGSSYGLPSDLTTPAPSNGRLTVVFGFVPEFVASADARLAPEAAPLSFSNAALPASTSANTQTAVVPEPATLVLVGLGLLGVVGLSRKRMR